LGFLFTNEMIN